MISTNQTDCSLGRHRPSRTRLARDKTPGRSALPHTHCRQCGGLLVRSPVTGRWRFTGILG
ncbi:hypothetical protein KY084_06640 [Stakelama sp. CBK3Z-3]|uniref:Uncharacterized protein n=1 Tax=Stakelama flava TaxID=2860338 RepID=A0ABS6XK30_9SPHN|nr:hypothetical protein [Stakelama flava]MBW4330552.1 hypothetical protein [Stakelama flava]